jgi:predicted nucleic acid-binding protein
MIMVPTPPKMWHKIMDLAWQIERQGKTMQVTDLTIASCALEIDATVLTLDSDFLRVPGLIVTNDLPS